MTAMTTPTVYPSVGAMLADATDRVQVRSSDAKSGSTFERLAIDGDRYFLKSLSYDEDWIMRVTGDVDHRPLLSWRTPVVVSSRGFRTFSQRLCRLDCR